MAHGACVRFDNFSAPVFSTFLQNPGTHVSNFDGNQIFTQYNNETVNFETVISIFPTKIITNSTRTCKGRTTVVPRY